MDKKEKQAMYKVLIFGAPFIVGLIMAFVMPIYANFAYKSYERTTVNFISSTINTDQLSYRTEFKTFQIDKRQLGKFLLGFEGATVYFDARDIPEALRRNIEIDELPFLKSDGYRVLIHLNSKKYSRSAIWSFDSKGVVDNIWTGSNR